MDNIGIIFDNFLFDNLIFHDYFVCSDKNCKEFVSTDCFIQPPQLKVYKDHKPVLESSMQGNWRRIFYNTLKNFAYSDCPDDTSCSLVSYKNSIKDEEEKIGDKTGTNVKIKRQRSKNSGSIKEKNELNKSRGVNGKGSSGGSSQPKFESYNTDESNLESLEMDNSIHGELNFNNESTPEKKNKDLNNLYYSDEKLNENQWNPEILEKGSSFKLHQSNDDFDIDIQPKTKNYLKGLNFYKNVIREVDNEETPQSEKFQNLNSSTRKSSPMDINFQKMDLAGPSPDNAASFIEKADIQVSVLSCEHNLSASLSIDTSNKNLACDFESEYLNNLENFENQDKHEEKEYNEIDLMKKSTPSSKKNLTQQQNEFSIVEEKTNTNHENRDYLLNMAEHLKDYASPKQKYTQQYKNEVITSSLHSIQETESGKEQLSNYVNVFGEGSYRKNLKLELVSQDSMSTKKGTNKSESHKKILSEDYQSTSENNLKLNLDIIPSDLTGSDKCKTEFLEYSSNNLFEEIKEEDKHLYYRQNSAGVKVDPSENSHKNSQKESQNETNMKCNFLWDMLPVLTDGKIRESTQRNIFYKEKLDTLNLLQMKKKQRILDAFEAFRIDDDFKGLIIVLEACVDKSNYNIRRKSLKKKVFMSPTYGRHPNVSSHTPRNDDRHHIRNPRNIVRRKSSEDTTSPNKQLKIIADLRNFINDKTYNESMSNMNSIILKTNEESSGTTENINLCNNSNKNKLESELHDMMVQVYDNLHVIEEDIEKSTEKSRNIQDILSIDQQFTENKLWRFMLVNYFKYKKLVAFQSNSTLELYRKVKSKISSTIIPPHNESLVNKNLIKQLIDIVLKEFKKFLTENFKGANFSIKYTNSNDGNKKLSSWTELQTFISKEGYDFDKSKSELQHASDDNNSMSEQKEQITSNKKTKGLPPINHKIDFFETSKYSNNYIIKSQSYNDAYKSSIELSDNNKKFPSSPQYSNMNYSSQDKKINQNQNKSKFNDNPRNDSLNKYQERISNNNIGHCSHDNLDTLKNYHIVENVCNKETSDFLPKFFKKPSPTVTNRSFERQGLHKKSQRHFVEKYTVNDACEIVGVSNIKFHNSDRQQQKSTGSKEQYSPDAYTATLRKKLFGIIDKKDHIDLSPIETKKIEDLNHSDLSLSHCKNQTKVNYRGLQYVNLFKEKDKSNDYKSKMQNKSIHITKAEKMDFYKYYHNILVEYYRDILNGLFSDLLKFDKQLSFKPKDQDYLVEMSIRGYRRLITLLIRYKQDNSGFIELYFDLTKIISLKQNQVSNLSPLKPQSHMKTFIKWALAGLNYMLSIIAINEFSKNKLKNLLLRQDINILAAFECFLFTSDLEDLIENLLKIEQVQFESQDANFTLALTKLSNVGKASEKNPVLTEDQRIFGSIKKFLPKPTVEFWSKVLIYDIFRDPDDKVYDCTPNELVTIHKKYLDKKITFNKMLSFLNEKSQVNFFSLSGNVINQPKISITTDLAERINQDMSWMNTEMKDFRFIKFLQEQLKNGDIEIINQIHRFSNQKNIGSKAIQEKFTKYSIKNLMSVLLSDAKSQVNQKFYADDIERVVRKVEGWGFNVNIRHILFDYVCNKDDGLFDQSFLSAIKHLYDI